MPPIAVQIAIQHPPQKQYYFLWSSQRPSVNVWIQRKIFTFNTASSSQQMNFLLSKSSLPQHICFRLFRDFKRDLIKTHLSFPNLINNIIIVFRNYPYKFYYLIKLFKNPLSEKRLSTAALISAFSTKNFSVATDPRIWMSQFWFVTWFRFA